MNFNFFLNTTRIFFQVRLIDSNSKKINDSKYARLSRPLQNAQTFPSKRLSRELEKVGKSRGTNWSRKNIFTIKWNLGLKIFGERRRNY